MTRRTSTRRSSARRSSKRLSANTLGWSLNQTAQDEGDTAANEARRIREAEASIHRAWRQLAYDEGESAVTAHRIATMTGLPAAYVREICERWGNPLRANGDKPTREEEKALKEYAEGLAQPFCACGRRWADCDGSRAKCRPRPLRRNGLYLKQKPVGEMSIAALEEEAEGFEQDGVEGAFDEGQIRMLSKELLRKHVAEMRTKCNCDGSNSFACPVHDEDSPNYSSRRLRSNSPVRDPRLPPKGKFAGTPIPSFTPIQTLAGATVRGPRNYRVAYQVVRNKARRESFEFVEIEYPPEWGAGVPVTRVVTTSQRIAEGWIAAIQNIGRERTP